MSLNNIQLQGPQLVELYPHVLVETGQATAIPENQGLRYLGNNARKITLVVSNDKAPFLTDGELSFLTSVLTACRLGLGDVAIVNALKMDGPSVAGAIESLEAKNVLLFGVPPLSIDLPMNFPPFQLQSYNGRIYLHSPSLPELEVDKTLKGKLWNCLKTLFGI